MLFGAPIATARYMGGREYEAIAQGAAEPTIDALIEVLATRQHRAAVVRQRRAVFRAARHSSRVSTALNVTQRAALATLYSALMTAQLIESLGTAGEIFVDGPLARNPLFAGLLGGVRAGGHGAHLPGRRRHARRGAPGRYAVADTGGTLQKVAPLRIPGLLEYQANWRHRLEERA